MHADFLRQSQTICRKYTGPPFRFDTPDLGKILRQAPKDFTPLEEYTDSQLLASSPFDHNGIEGIRRIHVRSYATVYLCEKGTLPEG